MKRWIATIALAFPAIGLAETEPEFSLCSSYVAKSEVREQSDLGWPVFVKLTEVGTRSLEAFTEANTGKMIRIVAIDRDFMRAAISSGELHGAFGTQEIATAWQQTLVGKLPAAPCGAGE